MSSYGCVISPGDMLSHNAQSHSWVKLLFVFLFWKSACNFLVPGELVLKEGTVRSVPTQESLGPVSNMHAVFNNRDLLVTAGL